MEKWLEEGALHPHSDPTQAGFLRVFAAWIIEEDLEFTTGESMGINRLFKYMESTFKLPSDTTVRNTLARIYTGMLEQVKSDLVVSFMVFRRYDSQ